LAPAQDVNRVLQVSRLKLVSFGKNDDACGRNGQRHLWRQEVAADAVFPRRKMSILLALLPGLVQFAVVEALAQGNPSARRSVRQVDYLDDKAMFQPAWNALLAKLPAGTRLYSIVIEDKQISVQGTSRQGADRLDEWTIRRGRFMGLFERDEVSGPHPVQVARHTASFASALFPLDDVAVDRFDKLIDAAVQRAALDDPARVTRIEIAHQLVILPQPRYGPLRIALSVSSGRESATIFALRDGTIVAADLSQTNRTARLDLLARNDWPMREAQEQLGALVGADATIRRIVVSHKRISLQRDDAANPQAAGEVSWDLSGAMVSPFSSLNLGRTGTEFLGFKLSELDFSRLPAVKANALAAFGTGGGVITDITARKALSVRGAGASEVLWHVQVQFPNTPTSGIGPFANADELGLASVRVDGAVASFRLPKRLRPPIDWVSGKGLELTLGALREKLGPDIRIQSVSLGKYGARIDLEDPAAPGKSVVLKYDEGGLAPDASSPPSHVRLEHAFTFARLEPAGIGGIAVIADEAYRRIGIADEKPTSIILYGSAGHRSPAGSPHLEVLVNGRRQGVITYRFATGEYTVVQH
jgi:hypothetical protein